jgi:hypothetical protein
MPWKITRAKFYKKPSVPGETDMAEDIEYKITPNLSAYEKSLLHDNKRLRGELALLADYIKPGWRDERLPLVAGWMLEELLKQKESE